MRLFPLTSRFLGSLLAACGVLLNPLVPLLSGCTGAASTAPFVDAGTPTTGIVAPEETDGGPLTSSVWTPRFDPLVQTILQERSELNVSGVAVAVFEQGEVVFAAGFGWRHPNGHQVVDADTLFRLGSVTKVLTATAIERAIDQEMLAPTDTVAQVLPDVLAPQTDPRINALTLDQLLLHTAGLADYLIIDDAHDDDALLRFFASPHLNEITPLLAPPGRMFNYSNTNYGLAGLMLQGASALPFSQAVQTLVLDPLGLEQTTFSGAKVRATGNYASGKTVDWYDDTYAAVAGPSSYDNGWARPAGYAWSSVNELAKFGIALLDDDNFLSERARQAMQGGQVNMQTALDDERYGHGLFWSCGFIAPHPGGTDAYYAVPTLAHDGDIHGYSADFMLLPSRNAGVAVLSNGDFKHFYRTLGQALALTPGLPPPTTTPRYFVDPNRLTHFVGSYLDAFNVGAVEIHEELGTLVADFPDLDRLGISYERTLVPSTPNNFFWRIEGDDLLLTFIDDDTGNVEYVRNRSFVATRMLSKQARSAQKSLMQQRRGNKVQAPRRDAKTLRALLHHAALRGVRRAGALLPR